MKRDFAFILDALIATGVTVIECVLAFGAHAGEIRDIATVPHDTRQAMNITWKTTFYTAIIDLEDWRANKGEVKWIETETRQNAYKAPGLYWQVSFDEKMRPSGVRITDDINLKQLLVNHQTKEATLRQLKLPEHSGAASFIWSAERQKSGNYRWVGKRTITNREANVFRRTWREDYKQWITGVTNMGWSQDLWIDAKTMQILRVQVPGADIYDPDKDPARNKPFGDKNGMKIVPLGWVWHNINYDAQLNESLFSLDPPEGYTVETVVPPKVTEKEMIEYLGVLAEYYNNSFPERYDKAEPHVAVPDYLPASEEFEVVEHKSERDRTAVQNRIVNKVHYYWQSNLNQGPFRHFIRDQTVEGTWKYVGQGIKLGDKNHLVCSYKLKGATTHRAVYGDLSVKDITPDALP